jgi:hypothetical protein
MNLQLWAWIVMTTALAAGSAAGPDRFEFRVRHQHVLKDCRGTLLFTSEGIAYRMADSKDARTWQYDDIQTIEVKSAAEVSLVTYEDQKRLAGKDRVFTFKLLDGKITPELSAFLLARVSRPMRLAVIPARGPAVYELKAKHLRPISGALGVLRVYADSVVFESDMSGDSRLWRYPDIERFAQLDRYRVQVVGSVSTPGGPTEAYTFELMRDLPDGLYDYVWTRLHPSSYYPEVPDYSVRNKQP